MTQLVSLKFNKENTFEPTKVRSATDVYNLMKTLVGESTSEHMYAFAMDGGNNITHIFLVAKGGQNQVMIDMKECFKFALLANACAIIFAHNHPTGDITPSKEDLILAEKMEKAAKLLDILMLDFIITGNGYWSQMEGN